METRNQFDVVRIRVFVNHDRGQVAEVDMEYTIRSTGNPKQIVLVSGNFLPNLRMTDSTGEEYPLMTSRDLRAVLGNDAGADTDSSGAHRLWFAIPPHKKLQKNEARVLHLTYEHPKKDAGILGAIKSLRTGAIMIKIPQGPPAPTFWILNKPADYNVSRRHYLQAKAGTSTHLGSWDDNTGAVFCRDTARSTTLHVKPGRNVSALSYSLAPKKIVLALPVAAIAMLSLLAISLVVVPHLDGGGPLQPIADAVALHKFPLLLFIIASSMAVPRFIDDAHLRNGLLWLYFVPVGLALFSFVL